MHIVLGLVGIGVMIILIMLFREMGKTRDEEMKKEITALQQQVSTVLERQEDMEKRLKNVELIVTDSRFAELPEAKEAINLKREMQDLKTMIRNLNKNE